MNGAGILAVLAVLAGSVCALVLVDRGVPNTAEGLGLWLIGLADRMRRRRAAIERAQAEQLWDMRRQSVETAWIAANGGDL
jgi:hypothetical protein